MALIPADVFTKYKEFADAMIAELGITCQIEYTDKIAIDPKTLPDVKRKNSMGMHRRGGGPAFKREGTTYETVTSTEDITCRVYWEPKRFVQAIVQNVPDGSIQTICYLTDLPKIKRANFFIANSEETGYEEWRFERLHEPTPWGIGQDRYILTTWKRSNG